MAPGRTDLDQQGANTLHAAKDQIVIKKQQGLKTDLALEHDLVLKTYRILIADLCQQYNMGHPGGAIGMAAIGVALWKYVMRYAPHTPDYFNRDRFVLSNGHTCLFQYAFLHLSGYKAMTWDQLKSYHSERPDSLCPGHPEIEIEGIEVTTGPLGQGVANAVGLAMATKNLQAAYNRPGFDVVSNHTWCMVGDACLQEGVGLEAISLAGHWKLNNLTIIYDNNQITCDGSVDMVNNEDINAKMRATGFHVLEVSDGCYDIDSIVTALLHARDSAQDKPTFVNVKTTIGLGSAVQGQAQAHGQPFGADDVAQMKIANGFDPHRHFVVAEDVRAFFADLPQRGGKVVQDWRDRVDGYCQEYPELGKEFLARTRGEMREDWPSLIPTSFPLEPTASRVSGGLVLNPLAKEINSFLVGTADLSPSVNMIWEGKVDFQSPNLQTSCGSNGTYAGRYLHYGIREHAMAGIANGLAAFARGTFLPVTSSFFMFYLYAAPAVRMGALQRLHVLHVATHDSIGAGEDGPTHQPVELAVLFRSMPNLLYLRPGDSEEVAGAYCVAIDYKDGPSIVSVSRHKIPQLHGGGKGKGLTRRDGVAKGAYVLKEADGQAQVTIIGVGAELSLAVDVARDLKDKRGVHVRVISFPCWRLFEQQPIEYRRNVLTRHGDSGIPAVVIEPYAPNGWERYADAGINLRTFGHSLPGKYIYKHFGFDVESLSGKVADYLDGIKEGRYIKGEFVDL